MVSPEFISRRLGTRSKELRDIGRSIDSVVNNCNPEQDYSLVAGMQTSARSTAKNKVKLNIAGTNIQFRAILRH